MTVDAHGPLANVAITVVRGDEHHDATSDRDGHYRISVPPGDYRLEARAGDHALVLVGIHAVVGTFGLDLVIDRSRAVTIADASIYPRHSSASACAWTCPLSTPPPQEWWVRAEPCPPGATLDQTVDGQSVTIRCLKPGGVLHGAKSIFGFDAEGRAHEHAEWYQDGTVCPTARDR